MHTDQSIVAGPIDGGPRLTYEEGQEYAPDDPWGLECLELAEDGTFTYRRRRVGQLVYTRVGAIGMDRSQAIFADLARSSFPEVPAHLSPPGPSMVSISMAPDRTVSLYRKFGMGLDGYREAITELTAIVSEAREASDPPTRSDTADES